MYTLTLLGIWVVFAGNAAVVTLGVGVVVAGASVMIFHRSITGRWMPRRFHPESAGFRGRRVVAALLFFPVFLWKVVASGVAVARLAVVPGVSFWPGIVAVPGGLSTLGSTAVLANLITLTPGTLTMDYDAQDDTLYIHWMDVRDYEAEDIDHQVTGGMRAWVQKLAH